MVNILTAFLLLFSMQIGSPSDRPRYADVLMHHLLLGIAPMNLKFVIKYADIEAYFRAPIVFSIPYIRYEARGALRFDKSEGSMST